MEADTSAYRATASICLAASRTISSSTEPLASLGSASSWTTLSMGVPSRPARQRRHMIRLAMGYRSSSGRCAPSRHPAEDHPQVLIIALRELGLIEGKNLIFEVSYAENDLDRLPAL